jgi:tetratricopeptide (TPR) repeat protein
MWQWISKRRLRNLSIALAAALAVGWAAERFDYRVRNDFFAGFTGDQAALERGMKACEETLASNPKHAQAMVWHGSGLLYLAGRSFQAGDAQKGAELWQRALKEMETAVALEPDSLSVRIPRGATSLQASLFAPPAQAEPLVKTGLADLEKVLEMQTPRFEQLGTHPRGELLSGLANGWYRLGDEEKARAYYARIARELPGTEYEKRAKIWLETKTLSRSQMTCVGCHVQ